MRALFDQRIPPGFTVFVARNLGEMSEWVAAKHGRWGFAFFAGSRDGSGIGIIFFLAFLSLRFRSLFRSLVGGQRVRRRQIDEAYGAFITDGPLHRLPLGRKLGKGIETRI